VGNDRQFRALCSVLGIPEAADDPRFATNADRVANRAALSEVLTARLSSWSLEPLLAALAQARVPAGPVNDVAEAFAFADAIGLDPVELAWRDGEAVPLVRSPLGLSDPDARPVARRPPPRLGEHDAEVRAWLQDRRQGSGATELR
jgi:crotonobetainyl-CoA:carnitine CoA-transferase CaiB-like acyl-CoA transferase